MVGDPEIFKMEFQSGGNTLAGRLLLPDARGPHPTVVFVHGSGSTTWDSNASYLPLFEVFLSKGVACFSWDKPGVGDSTGDWRMQTFQARAKEVADAINALKNRDEVDSAKIGMWGISQAGWIMPLVCEQVADIAFVVAVSVPVVTVAEQDLYRIGASMPADGYTFEETAAAIEASKSMRELIERGASYEEARALFETVENKPWIRMVITQEPTPEAYEWFKAVAALDFAPDITSIKCPVIAIFGEKDKIVNPVQSSRRYETVLREAGNVDVTARIVPGANHAIRLAETGGQQESEEMTRSGNWKYAPEYLKLLSDWLEERFS